MSAKLNEEKRVSLILVAMAYICGEKRSSMFTRLYDILIIIETIPFT